MVRSGRSLLLGGLIFCSSAPSVAVDSDGDTDLTDFQSFRDCLCGPFVGAGSCRCLLRDLDCDGDVDLRDLSLFTIEFTGSLAQQHLELDPAAVCLVPEERVPLVVELVEPDGVRTSLDASQFSLAIEGVSGGVALQKGKPVARVFESGDVGLCGELAATFQGLVGRTRFAVAALSPSDETELDHQLLDHGQRLDDYAHARAKHDSAAGAFESEHTKLANAEAATFLRHEAFVFFTTFGALTGGDNSPPCSEIRRPLGPPTTTLQCDQGFFELIDLGGAEVAFFVEVSDQVLLSNGSLGACPNPGAPLSDPSGCSRLFVLVRVQIRQLSESGVSEAIVQEHLDVGPAPLTAISASYVEGKTAEVLYLQNPPLFCASVFNSGGTIGFTANECNGDRSGITTVGIDTSNVVWEFQAYTPPRENWINHQLTSIGVAVSTPQYRDLGEAETAVMNLLAGLAKAELELALRKQQALAQLNALDVGPSGGTRASTDYAVEFLQPYIDALKDQGQEFVTEQIIDTIEEELGLPLEQVSEPFNELSGIVDQMKTAADLFNLLPTSIGRCRTRIGSGR